MGLELQGSAAALASYRERTTQSFESLETHLNDERIDVDAASEQLSELRRGLTERLDDFGKAQTEAYTEHEEEMERMRLEMEGTCYSTVDQSQRGGTILDVLNPGTLYWSVGSYNAGYTAGTNSVDQSRHSSNSSGSVSTGYSGGGSFSGSGGSSRL